MLDEIFLEKGIIDLINDYKRPRTGEEIIAHIEEILEPEWAVYSDCIWVFIDIKNLCINFRIIWPDEKYNNMTERIVLLKLLSTWYAKKKKIRVYNLFAKTEKKIHKRVSKFLDIELELDKQEKRNLYKYLNIHGLW